MKCNNDMPDNLCTTLSSLYFEGSMSLLVRDERKFPQGGFKVKKGKFI